MFDDDDHITISYCHEGESWFEMDLYLPMLVTCPKNKMPKILNQFIKDEKCEDASNLDALLDELRNLACDDDTPEAVAMPSRIVLLSNDIMQILNHLPHLIAPKKDVPYTVRRAEMLGAIKDAMLDARADIVTVLARYPEFAEITDKYFDDDEEDTAETE